MNLQQLHQIITASVKDKTASLDITSLKSSAINELLKTLLPNNIFSLNNAQLKQTDQSVQLNGMGNSGFFNGMLVVCEFIIEENIAHLLISAWPSGRFTFDDGFEALGNSLFTEIFFRKEAVFYLNSLNKGDTIEKGMFFEGIIDVEKTFGKLAFLAGGLEPELKGFIEPDNDAPFIYLEGPLTKSIDLGILQLNDAAYEIHSRPVFSTINNRMVSEVFFLLKATLQINAGQKKISVPVYATAATFEGTIELYADFAEVLNFGISELDSLFGKGCLNGLLPAGLELDQLMKVAALCIRLSPFGDTKLIHCALELQSAKPFVLIDQLLTLKNIVLHLEVNQPFSKPSVNLFIGGEVELLSDAVFELEAGLPDFMFSGHLSDNSQLSLQQLVNYFIPGIAFPAIALDELSVYCNFKEKQLAFSAELLNTTPVVLGNLTLLPLQAILEFEYDKGNCKGSIKGLMAVNGIAFSAAASFSTTEKELVLSGGLESGSSLNFHALLTSLLPDITIPTVVPNVMVDECNFTANLTAKSLQAKVRISSTWSLSEQFAINKLWCDITVQPKAKSFTATGELGGELSLLGTTIAVTAKLQEQISFTGTIPALDLNKICEQLAGTKMPEELPAIRFTDLSFSITPATGAFGISGKTTIEWDYAGAGIQTKTSVELDLKKTATNAPLTCKLIVNSSGTVNIVEDCSLQQLNLLFEVDADKTWTVNNGLTIKLYQEAITLKAGYQYKAGVRTLVLSTKITGDKPLVSLPDIGFLQLSSLELAIKKAAAPAPPAWKLSAEGAIHINGIADFKGLVTIYKDDESAGISFTPDKADITLPLAFPNLRLSLQLGFGDISLKRTGGKKNAAWAFAAAVNIAVTGLPPYIQQVLPKTISVQFAAGSSGISFSATAVGHLLELAIPDIVISEKSRIVLGKAAFSFNSIQLLVGKEIALTAKAAFGIPSELNKIFGVKQDGTACVDLFNCYDPAKPAATMVGITLSLGTAGVSIVVNNAPFKAIQFETDKDGITWWNCDFGEFGAIKFKVPVFSLDAKAGAFKASGGFTVTKPLALPLTPLKQLLLLAKLDKAAALLPNSLPLKGLDILDPQGNAKVEELIKLIEQAGLSLNEEAKKILRGAAQYFNKLPADLKTYLNIQLPQSFLFDISVTPDGGVRFDVSVAEETEPVKLLFPSMSPLPMLNGITLRKIAFGSILGGNFFLLEADFVYDQFDLLSIAAALLGEQIPSLPLSPAGKLQRKLIVNNLFTIIDYKVAAMLTGLPIPIPVPLFYDKLGIQYHGLESISIQAHASFKKPKINAIEIGKLVMKLKKFFSDKEALLDVKDPPKDIDLVFSLPDNYIQLPPYLGGNLIGIKGDGPEISLYKTVATLMNTLKKPDINALVQTIPFIHRKGSVQAALGPIAAAFTWLVTTPKEFREEGPAVLNINAADTRSFMQVLPEASGLREAAGNEQGMVIFMRGACSIAGMAGFEAVFGLAASATIGFHTGFRVKGVIAGMLDVELKGTVAIKPAINNQTPFAVEGYAHLVFLNHRLFTGSIQITNEGFALDGEIALFPKESVFKAGGNIKGDLSKNRLYLHAATTVQLGNLTLAAAAVTILNKDITITGTWLDQRLTLQLLESEGMIALKGEIGINIFALQVQATLFMRSDGQAYCSGSMAPVEVPGILSIKGVNQERPSATLQLRPGQIPLADANISVKLLGFETTTLLSLKEDGFRFTLTGKMFNLFAATLTVNGSNFSSPGTLSVEAIFQNDLPANIQREARAFVDSKTSDIIRRLQDARNELQKAKNEVNRLENVIIEKRREVEAERYAATATLRSWQEKVAGEQRNVDGILGTIRAKEREADWHWNNGAYGAFGIWYWHGDSWAITHKLKIEIAALYIAYGTATAALKTAETALKIAEGACNFPPVDSDPRVWPVIGLKETALKGLEIADGVLKGIMQTIGALQGIVQFIIDHGLDAVVQVHGASFTASLGAASGGQVQLKTEISYLNNRRTDTFNFNFNDIPGSCIAITKQLTGIA
jgi:hypothetical protein